MILLFAMVVGMGLYVALSQTGNLEIGGNGNATSSGVTLQNTLFWWRNVGRGTSSVQSPPPQSPPQKNVEQPKPVPPVGFSEKDLSPFYGQVRITSVNPPDPYTYSPMHVFTLAAESGNKEPIFITGWRVKGNRRQETYVPNGISDMNPVSVGGAQTRIALSPGEYANFYTNASSIGRNFRLNKCTGFLNNFYAFVPVLPNECPALFERGEVITFSGECQSFLFSLPSCANIDPNDRNLFTGENDNGCRTVMDRYNFGYCYNRLRSQPNFFSLEWKVWLSERPNFDRQHDRILLLDNVGLLVDEYVY